MTNQIYLTLDILGGFIQRSAIDKPTGDQKIEIHFINQRRCQLKSDFSRQFTKDRMQDLILRDYVIHNQYTLGRNLVNYVSYGRISCRATENAQKL